MLTNHRRVALLVVPLLIAAAPVQVTAKVTQKSSVSKTKKAGVKKQRATRKRASVVRSSARRGMALRGKSRIVFRQRAVARSAPAYRSASVAGTLSGSTPRACR